MKTGQDTRTRNIPSLATALAINCAIDFAIFVVVFVCAMIVVVVVVIIVSSHGGGNDRQQGDITAMGQEYRQCTLNVIEYEGRSDFMIKLSVGGRGGEEGGGG